MTASHTRGDGTTDDETAVTGRTPDAEQPALARVLSGRMLVFLVLGDVLGSGIYALTGQIAADVGGMIWAPFLIAFTLALLTGTSYAELAGKHPRAAGAALYADQAFRRPYLTFMVGFTVLAAGITSTATAAQAIGGEYLTEFVTAPVVVVAVVFLLLTAVLNARGIEESARVNLVLTVIELAGLLLIVGIGVYALLTGTGEPGRAFELRAEGPAPLALLAGTTLAFYSMLGFENSVNLVEEARRPRRDLPRALFGGMFIAGIVYLFVAFTSAALVDPDVLAGSSAPLLEVLKASDVPVPPKLFAAVALVAVANTALINMVMASRLVYGMAAQGTIPAVFARVLPGRRTPPVAIGLVTALAVALACTGQLAGLADTTVLLLLLVFLIVNISALALRREPALPGAYRAPTWAPALGALSCAVLATPLVHREGTAYLRALGLLAIAALVVITRKVVNGRFRACASRPPSL
ncbi:APC family permease [Frankia sp. R43]|uniref:APC family permease n=1 Tax=Frankia sp. R43 TaxID=269536 RepID=UPI0009FA7F23